jgi:hypothetical protein
VKNVLLTDAIDSVNKLVKKGKGLNKQLIEERRAKVRVCWENGASVMPGMPALSCLPTDALLLNITSI